MFLARSRRWLNHFGLASQEENYTESNGGTFEVPQKQIARQKDQ